MHTTHIVHLPFPLAFDDLDDPHMKKQAAREQPA